MRGYNDDRGFGLSKLENEIANNVYWLKKEVHVNNILGREFSSEVESEYRKLLGQLYELRKYPRGLRTLNVSKVIEELLLVREKYPRLRGTVPYELSTITTSAA
jgi:hypothetical protein